MGALGQETLAKQA